MCPDKVSISSPSTKNFTRLTSGKFVSVLTIEPIKNETSEQALNVKVYYPDDSGMRLVEVEREIIVDDSTDKYTAALEALKEEPDEENLTTIFPKNASIKKVTVQDGLATVDFDGSILKSFVGG